MLDIKNRAFERTDVNWISIIRLPNGQEIPCSIKDVSQIGMKVALSSEVTIPDAFNIRVVGRDLIFNVKQAWRRGHFVGLTILKIGKLPATTQAPSEDAPASTTSADYNRLGARRSFRSRE
ncbi:PilZ domain-containing protein [Methylorubrum extorquens]|uniref:PilZ domain-containing protein n=1 Tax=Methylorubrum extorquens TaxID=408 RepID=UPI000972E88F|nr:PilZ domain-containing protein [Methylorubrum extorquens]APX84473.1 PilZ domain-containing protein [Methylorubrum extorquens]